MSRVSVFDTDELLDLQLFGAFKYGRSRVVCQ